MYTNGLKKRGRISRNFTVHEISVFEIEMEDGYCKLFKNNQGLRGASIISPGKRELLISKNESSGNKGYGGEHRNVNFEEGKFPSLEI